jgi:hypothetical protein
MALQLTADPFHGALPRSGSKPRKDLAFSISAQRDAAHRRSIQESGREVARFVAAALERTPCAMGTPCWRSR